jgi:serine/threonine protein kinase
MKQVGIFGPVPLSFGELANGERLSILTAVINIVHEHNLPKPFHLLVDKELSEEHRTFMFRIMKFDPRDRPTAQEHLQDEWFNQKCLISNSNYL